MNKDEPAQPDATADAQEAPVAHPRLPCRGCLANCVNYAVCGGHPWREDIPAQA